METTNRLNDWEEVILDLENNIKKFSAMELTYIREKSYYKYDPPNFHMIYMMFALMFFSFMFFSLHMQWFGLNLGEFPKFHKQGFLISEIISFIGGLAILPYWWKKEKESRKNWKEMQEIRKIIDTELKNR